MEVFYLLMACDKREGEEVYYIVSAFSFVCKISFFRGMIYFFKNGFDFLFRYGKKGVP